MCCCYTKHWARTYSCTIGQCLQNGTLRCPANRSLYTQERPLRTRWQGACSLCLHALRYAWAALSFDVRAPFLSAACCLHSFFSFDLLTLAKREALSSSFSVPLSPSRLIPAALVSFTGLPARLGLLLPILGFPAIAPVKLDLLLSALGSVAIAPAGLSLLLPALGSVAIAPAKLGLLLPILGFAAIALAGLSLLYLLLDLLQLLRQSLVCCYLFLDLLQLLRQGLVCCYLLLGLLRNGFLVEESTLYLASL